MKLFCKYGLAAYRVVLCFRADVAESSTTQALVGATVVNLNGGAPLRNAVVLVEGERISGVGGADEFPGNNLRFLCKRATVRFLMPWCSLG
jgi:hypothetical protein